MRTIILSLSILFACISNANAQEVFNEVLHISQDAAKKNYATQEEKDVIRFRLDAIDYLGMKTAEQMPDSSAIILDKQAYALYEFLHIFYNIQKDYRSKTAKEKMTLLFQEASLACPRFDDAEEEITKFYVNKTGFCAPFCLNTDWEKAVKIVKNKGYYYE